MPEVLDRSWQTLRENCGFAPPEKLPGMHDKVFNRDGTTQFAVTFALKEVSQWLCVESTEVGSVNIFRVAVQATDRTLPTDLVIDVGMIVRRACADTFKFGDAN